MRIVLTFEPTGLNIQTDQPVEPLALARALTSALQAVLAQQPAQKPLIEGVEGPAAQAIAREAVAVRPDAAAPRRGLRLV